MLSEVDMKHCALTQSAVLLAHPANTEWDANLTFAIRLLPLATLNVSRKYTGLQKTNARN